MQQFTISCRKPFIFFNEKYVFCKKKPPATFPITGVHYRRLFSSVRVLNEKGLDSEKAETYLGI